MRLDLPLCLFDRHLPRRKEAHRDGLQYVTTCRLCGARLRRRSHGGWRRDWLEPHAAK